MASGYFTSNANRPQGRQPAAAKEPVSSPSELEELRAIVEGHNDQILQIETELVTFETEFGNSLEDLDNRVEALENA